jgi:hypothetical protein
VETNLKMRTTVLTVFFVAFFLCSLGLRSQQRWAGFVTDTHCGTNCQVTKNMTPDKECIERCIRKGSKYGLWVNHHVYELEPQSKAARYAAQDVSVTGTLNGGTIHITSIEPTNVPTARKSDSH